MSRCPPVAVHLLAAVFLLLSGALVPAGAQVRGAADALQLTAASGMRLQGGRLLNPCGHPTNPLLKFIDLNGDGVSEVVSQDRDPACYGPTPGIQSKVLARDRSGRWMVIGIVPGIVKPIAGRSSGWANFTVEGKGCQPVWRFGGRGYLPTACPPAAPSAAKDAGPAIPPVASAPASAPAGVNRDLSLFPETHGRFAPGGGDCAGLPRVTIGPDAIRVETAAGAAAFPKAGVITNYLGPDDPAITYFLQGPGAGLVLSVQRNEAWTSGGDGLGAVEKAAATAADVNGAHLRRCGAQVPDPAPEPASQVRTSAAGDIDALLKDGYSTDPGFLRAYRKALGSLVSERWLTSFEGPGESKAVTLDGTRYLLASVCKPHDCGDNAMLVLYRPDTGFLFGIVSIRRNKRPVGNPPTELRPELLRLWKEEWPAG